MSGLALLTGKTDDELAREAAVRLLGGRGVEHSGELERILALPRRPLDLAYGKQIADMITERYCTRDDAGNRIGTMNLLPIQGLALANAYEGGGLFAMLGVGRGKAQPDTEPVLLDRGWTPIGEVRVGDRIYGSDGELHNVTGVFPQGMPQRVWRVTFSDHTFSYCSGEHLWTFRRKRGGAQVHETKSLRHWAYEWSCRGTMALALPALACTPLVLRAAGEGHLDESVRSGRAVRGIEETDHFAKMTCISVDAPDHLYVTRFCVLTHNTLISLFAPLLVGCQKPMLLVPAKLRDKTHRDIARYKKHFRLGSVYVESYEKISHINGQGILEGFEPDMLILDECSKVRRPSAAVSKRVRRYVAAHPNVRVVALSGTVANRSLKDFAHILEWCFRSRSPAPQKYLVVEEWASAVDVKISAWGGLGRLGPGALVQLWSPEDHKTAATDPVSASRNAIRRRVVETNGVVSTTDPGIDTALWIDIKHKAPGKAALDAIKLLKAKEETPCGYALATPLERWRHELTMQVGYYQLWDPEAPKDWLVARSRWAACVRHALQHMQKLDSELSVANALEHAKSPITISITKVIGNREVEIDGLEALREWRAIRDTFVPNPVPTWIDDTYLNAAAAWAKEAPGILWTAQVAFAEELARRTGLPYYGDKGGRNALTGKHLEPDEDGTRSVIASINSCRDGLNLQAFNRNLVPCPISVGEWTEQMIGRTHRQGQEADEVSFEYWLGCTGAYKAMWQCFEDARFALTTTGNQQRLLFADMVGLTHKDLEAAF